VVRHYKKQLLSGVYLLKPNQDELAALIGNERIDIHDIIPAP